MPHYFGVAELFRLGDRPVRVETAMYFKPNGEMTQTVLVIDRKLVSPAGTVTLVLNILLLPNHLLTKVTVPAIDTSLLSIT